MEEELDDEIYDELTMYSDNGNMHFENEDFQSALVEYKKAFDLLPAPIEKWEAATWLTAALGDTYFQLKNYEQAKYYLSITMHCPGGLGTPFVHMRLGETQFELGNKTKAADELIRAYMGGGEEVFEQEDEKYIDFLNSLI